MTVEGVDNKDYATNRIDELIVRAAKKGSENPIVTWTLSNIPVYGPLFQRTASLEGTILKRRIKNLGQFVHDEAQKVDTKKMDFSYFETEEYYDIVRRTLDYTLQTRNETKIRLYARILVRLPLFDNAVFRSSSEYTPSVLYDAVRIQYE